MPIGYSCDGKIIDLHQCHNNLKNKKKVTINSPEGREIFRHSGAHLLAHAISELYTQVCYGIGPTTIYGSYYNISCKESISSDKFQAIEKKMLEIIERKLPIKYKNNYSIQEIKTIFKDDPIKSSIINQLVSKGTSTFSTYSQGKFIDLCRGPHLLNTSDIPKFFKIISISQIKHNNHKLQRINMVHFLTKKELKTHLDFRLEQKNRDHRILGVKLGLFQQLNEAPGFLLWQPDGLKIKDKLKTMILETTIKGFHTVETPAMLTSKLWEKTGHMDKYKENMYHFNNLSLKPMNCPAHGLFFRSESRSYKDLPFRVFEFGSCFRREAKGALLGLKRTCNFVQDDGHIFCTHEHITGEVQSFLKRAEILYKKLGFPIFKIKFATRPDKYIGTIEQWNNAEQLLENALTKFGKDYSKDIGGGAFYGPKIELHIKDHYDQWWQCGTIQLDFFLAKNLKIYYGTKNNQRAHPLVLHRATLGSLERFFAIFLEHHNGLGPLCLYDAVIIPVNIQKTEYQPLIQPLAPPITYIIDDEDQRLGKKIHYWKNRVKQVIIIGPKEVETFSVHLWKDKKNYHPSELCDIL